MHQPTDGWLSLLSFVASPHHFPSRSIRKQRWKRETETGWQRREIKRERESIPPVLQGCFFKGSNRNEKFYFWLRMYAFVAGELSNSLNSVNVPLKILFLLNLCVIAQLTLWLFRRELCQQSHIFFFYIDAQKIFMVSIKIKWQFYKDSSNLQYKLRGNSLSYKSGDILEGSSVENRFAVYSRLSLEDGKVYPVHQCFFILPPVHDVDH